MEVHCDTGQRRGARARRHDDGLGHNGSSSVCQRVVKTGLRTDGQVQILGGLQRGRIGGQRRCGIPEQHAAGAALGLDLKTDGQFFIKRHNHVQVSHRILPEPPRHRLLGLLLFTGAGFVAFKMLNIEAYPNPTPVILEITAQAPGLSAEEMERYYTRPMEIGLYSTPGIEVIRSTSFYGLSFVRVSFKYGVDYFFAYSQASVALAAEREPARQSGSQHPGQQFDRRNLSLSGRRAAALWNHQSPHGSGLDRRAPAC